MAGIVRGLSPAKLCSYTGLCPRVYQSGGKDRRGSLAKTGPKYLRWALIEAATHACRHWGYRDHYCVSMYQIASASLSASSTRATFLPRCLPRRFLVALR